MDTEPTLGDVINQGLHRLRVGIRTCIPAEVVSFSRAPFRHVRVKLGIQRQLISGEFVDNPEIDRVPIVWPCGGGFSIDADLLPGEAVLLIVPDRDIGEWLQRGGVCRPGSGRMHHVSDAIAIPGLFSQADPQTQTPGAGTLYVGSRTGDAPWVRLSPSSVAIEAPAVNLGAAATRGVARMDDSVDVTGSDALPATWAGFFKVVATAINGLGVPLTVPVTPIGKISSASTKAKSE